MIGKLQFINLFKNNDIKAKRIVLFSILNCLLIADEFEPLKTYKFGAGT